MRKLRDLKIPARCTDPSWLLPRASVGLGIAATTAMNIAAGSRGGPGGALMGVLPPVGFVISLETLIVLVRRLARRDWGWAWCVGAGIPLAGLAGLTGIISYLHALTVAVWTASSGEAGLVLTEHIIPLVADLMIATGSVALLALAVSPALASTARTAKASITGKAAPAVEGTVSVLPRRRGRGRADRGPAPLCKCGCGQRVTWSTSKTRWNKYADRTHQFRTADAS